MIEILKQRREQVQEALDQVHTLQVQLEQTKEFKNLEFAKDYLSDMKAELAEVEKEIKNDAIAEYLLTENKELYPGVKVVQKKVLIYEPNRAIEWAIVNGAMDMVSLKKSPFEKHARAVVDSVPLPFVEIKTEPAVRIAKDL